MSAKKLLDTIHLRKIAALLGLLATIACGGRGESPKGLATDSAKLRESLTAEASSDAFDARATPPIATDSPIAPSSASRKPARRTGGAAPTQNKVLSPPNRLAGEAPSPTGRNPRLLWTRHRQWAWSEMRSKNHPWYQLAKDNADRTLTRGERYGDKGQWAMLIYQITGNTEYGRRAWQKAKTWVMTDRLNQNMVREHFIEAVLLYDWLYPVLTTAERAEFQGALERWAEFALGKSGGRYVGGFRTADSDQTIGAYFGLAFLDLATAPDNPRAGKWLSAEAKSGIPVGGLDATKADRSTIRNTIAHYVKLAEGGDWIESVQYNLGTAVLLLLGAEGVKTATGVDHFPEVTKLARQMATAYPYLVSPDMKQSVQWGDDEHPRDFVSRLYRHTTFLGVLAGVTEGTEEGRIAQAMIANLVGKYGYTGRGSAEPHARALYLYSPYAATSDPRTLPSYHFSPGVGLMYYKDGQSLFMAHAANLLGVDHGTKAMGTFQLYRNGEWAITHPIGYGSLAVSAAAANTMLIAGLNVMYDREILESRSGRNWASMTMRTGGSYYDPSYHNPPEPFLHNWTRSIVYFKEGDADVIVTWDSVKADDPQSLGRFNRYRNPDQATIKAAPNLVEWQLHTPVAPLVGDGKLSWTTPGRQSVVVYTLAPADQKATIYDENVIWAANKSLYPKEKKFQVRITATDHRREQVFLNVIVVGSKSLTATAIPGGVRVGGTTIKFGPNGTTVTSTAD